jgi:hypothetical protein
MPLGGGFIIRTAFESRVAERQFQQERLTTLSTGI